jgi:hypothetical protein
MPKQLRCRLIRDIGQVLSVGVHRKRRGRFSSEEVTPTGKWANGTLDEARQNRKIHVEQSLIDLWIGS